jgi:tetratricopeptide (TPR) repeat protein
MIALLSFILAAPPPAVTPAIAKLAGQADAARESGRMDEALALYGKAVGLSPQWGQGWWAIGKIHYDQDRYPQCRDAFRRFTTLDSKSAPGMAMLGLCEFQTREYPQALSHLEKAEQLGLRPEQELYNVTLYHLALLQTRAGFYERAIELCRTLRRNDFNPEWVIAVSGVAALRKPLFPQDLPEADRELAFMLGKAVSSPDIPLGGDWRRDFADVLKSYPSAPNFHYWYGTALLAADPDQGLAELKTELEGSPNHVPALLQIVFEYLKRGEPENAKPFAERAAKAAPRDFAARASLGRVLVLTNEEPSGIQELETAVKLAPDSRQTRFWLAQAYCRTGQNLEESRRQLEAIIKDSPNFVEAHMTLATVYYRLKRKDDGDREHAIVLKLNEAARPKGTMESAKPADSKTP